MTSITGTMSLKKKLVTSKYYYFILIIVFFIHTITQSLLFVNFINTIMINVWANDNFEFKFLITKWL